MKNRDVYKRYGCFLSEIGMFVRDNVVCKR